MTGHVRACVAADHVCDQCRGSSGQKAFTVSGSSKRQRTSSNRVIVKTTVCRLLPFYYSARASPCRQAASSCSESCSLMLVFSSCILSSPSTLRSIATSELTASGCCSDLVVSGGASCAAGCMACGAVGIPVCSSVVCWFSSRVLSSVNSALSVSACATAVTSCSLESLFPDCACCRDCRAVSSSACAIASPLTAGMHLI